MGARNAVMGEAAEIHTGEVSEYTSEIPVAESRRERVFRRLFGPRLIDLPIRLLVFIVAITGLMPGSFESEDPRYVMLSVVALGLMITATYVPKLTATVAAILFLLFALVLPEFLNPFQDAIEFSAAMLLTRFQWVRSLIVTAVVFGLTIISHLIAPAGATPFEFVVFTWIAYSVFALAFGLFELRITREIDLRERNAREHERRLQSERIGFAINTHDTVSHGLATQGALIRLLSRESDERERHRLLGEFAMINGDTQLQLRTLLAGLSAAKDGRAPAVETNPAHELTQAASTLRSAAEVGGIDLSIDLDLDDARIDADVLADVKLMMRELVTNMVKHSEGAGSCLLRGRVDGSQLVLESLNPTGTDVSTAPRSLTARAESRGGSCIARSENGTYRVTVRIPHATQEFPQAGDV